MTIAVRKRTLYLLGLLAVIALGMFVVLPRFAPARAPNPDPNTPDLSIATRLAEAEANGDQLLSDLAAYRELLTPQLYGELTAFAAEMLPQMAAAGYTVEPLEVGAPQVVEQSEGVSVVEVPVMARWRFTQGGQVIQQRVQGVAVVELVWQGAVEDEPARWLAADYRSFGERIEYTWEE